MCALQRNGDIWLVLVHQPLIDKASLQPRRSRKAPALSSIWVTRFPKLKVPGSRGGERLHL